MGQELRLLQDAESVQQEPEQPEQDNLLLGFLRALVKEQSLGKPAHAKSEQTVWPNQGNS
ncbi:MAG: hypothetical protein AAB116_21670 [Candidatus Poribacteria bacterium]